METLEEYIERHTQNKERSSDFVEFLFLLMERHGYKDRDSGLYKKANISRQLWSSIISGKSMPGLNTLLKIVFTLQLNNKECKYLLKKAGFTLASNSKFSLIIRYCIENQIYDLFVVNQYLEDNGYGDRLIY